MFRPILEFLRRHFGQEVLCQGTSDTRRRVASNDIQPNELRRSAAELASRKINANVPYRGLQSRGNDSKLPPLLLYRPDEMIVSILDRRNLPVAVID
jgi:hypothetical protein